MDPTIDGDPAMSDDSFYEATVVLLLPFVLIPLSIILARLFKYAWKIYEAKKYGYDDGILQDPLAELGLKFRRDTTADIRKIKKERVRNQEKRALIQQKKERDEIAERVGGEVKSGFQEFAPLQAAEEYLAQLRASTARTWYEKLSPNAVRRWVNTSRYARLWMVLQVTCTFLAIVNYVALTYLANRDDRDERTLIKNLDIAYASFFLLDYFLSFYIAEDRLRFYFNAMSLIDLMSIVSPFVYLFVASPTKYVWFIGFVRIFRATRILRTYRLLSFAQSEESRELTIFVLNFLNFLFFSASIINATEALNFSQSPPSLKNWHDSLYYIMVTFSTIGFGDLTPSSTVSRVVVMVLIVLVILYIPWQTGKIIEIFNSLSRFQRASHSLEVDRSHVILTGEISYEAIIDFCREFFIADDYSSIVIVHPSHPEIQIRRLLNHPFYRSRLKYLQGDVMSLPDLKRAKAAYSTGMFILTADSTSTTTETNDTTQVNDVDANILFRALFVKTSFPGLPIYAQVNNYRSRDLSLNCGIDRLVCMDEIKATLFASNCACPGIQTLILNLIHSYKDVEPDIMKEFWTQEYQCGLVNQIQSFKIPIGLVGVTFSEATHQIYDNFNSIMFALTTVNAGFNQNKIRFAVDKDYRLKVDDIAFCIGNGGDELSIGIALHFKEPVPKEIREQEDLEIELSDLRTSPSLPKNKESPFLASPNQASTPNFDEISIGSVPENLSGHIIVSGFISARILLLFIKSLRDRRDLSSETDLTYGAHNNSPIVLILDNLPDIDDIGGIWLEIMSYHSVYLIKGRAVQRTSLMKASIATCSRIVVFSKQGLSSGTSDAQSVFLEWPKVKFLVELIDGTNVKYFSSNKIEWDNNNLRMQSIMNNYALGLSDRQSLTRSLRTEGLEKTKLIYQFINFINGSSDDKKRSKSNKQDIKKSAVSGDYQQLKDGADEIGSKNAITEVYLQRALEQAELNDSGLSPYPVYHFDRFFAAGMVASSSFMQCLLCQSYFRPFIIDIVRGLIAHTYSLPVKAAMVGKQYYELVEACLSQGYVPLGLYRNGGLRTNEKLPYVYTNPQRGDIINAHDLVFVLKR